MYTGIENRPGGHQMPGRGVRDILSLQDACSPDGFTIIAIEILGDQFSADVGQEDVDVLDLPASPSFGIFAVEMVPMYVEDCD